MSIDYEKIKNAIEKNNDIIDFADFGNGVSAEWITKCEERINLPLPESYKWWLMNYSGGEINGEEIFSIYEQDFDSVVGGDLVYMYELNLKNFGFSKNMIPICETDDDIYYFDSSISNEGEYPIYSFNNKCLYAKNFCDFIIKRINANK